MKTKFYIFVLLLFSIISIGNAQYSYSVSVGPDTPNDTSDDIVATNNCKDPGGVFPHSEYLTVSDLPTLNDDLAFLRIRIQATISGPWDAVIKLKSPSGTEIIVADSDLGSWPNFDFGTVNNVYSYNCTYPEHNQSFYDVPNFGDRYIKLVTPTDGLIGEDPNGFWELEICSGSSTIINIDRITLNFLSQRPWAHKSLVNTTNATNCTSDDGAVEFQIIETGECGDLGAFYSVDDGPLGYTNDIQGDGIEREKITVTGIGTGNHTIKVYRAINPSLPDYSKVNITEFSILANDESMAGFTMDCEPDMFLDLGSDMMEEIELIPPTNIVGMCYTPVSISNIYIKKPDGITDVIDSYDPALTYLYNFDQLGQYQIGWTVQGGPYGTLFFSDVCTQLITTDPNFVTSFSSPLCNAPGGQTITKCTTGNDAQLSPLDISGLPNALSPEYGLIGIYLDATIAQPLLSSQPTVNIQDPLGNSYRLFANNSFPQYDPSTQSMKVRFTTCNALSIPRAHEDAPFVEGGTYRAEGNNNLNHINQSGVDPNGTWNLSSCTGLPFDVNCFELDFGNMCAKLDNYAFVEENCQQYIKIQLSDITDNFCSDMNEDGLPDYYIAIEGTIAQWDAATDQLKMAVLSGIRTLEFGELQYDANGNQILACKQYMDIDVPNTTPDTEDPILTNCPPNQTVALDANGQIKLSITQPTFSDNCGIDMRNFTVMFLDGVTNSNGSTTPIMTTFTSEAVISPTFIGTGRVVLNYEVKDLAGNTSTCGATITTTDSTDPEKPVITACPPAQTVTLKGNGTQIFDIVHPSATDNVGVTTKYLNIKYLNGATDIAGNNEYSNLLIRPGISRAYNIKGAGSVQLDFRFEDAAGNFDVCQTTITSILSASPCTNDVEAPIITNCPRDFNVVLGADGIKDFEIVFPIATDNCNVATGILNFNYFDGATDKIGVTSYGNGDAFWVKRTFNIKGEGRVVIDWIFTDDAGNSNSCTTTVSSKSANACANDTEKPEFTGCNGDITALLLGPSGKATFDFTDPTYTENCEVATESHIINYLDGATNETGGILNEFNYIDQDKNYLYQVVGTGKVEFNYEVTDVSGNKGTCKMVIFVKNPVGPCDNDVTKPVLQDCPPNASVVLDATTNTASYTIKSPIASDNCGLAIRKVYITHSEGATGPNGETSKEINYINDAYVSKPFIIARTGKVVYEFRVTDPSGNIQSCFTTITSTSTSDPCDNDTEDPILVNCPLNQTVALDANGQIQLSITQPTFSDNCGIDMRNFTVMFLDGVTNSNGTTTPVMTTFTSEAVISPTFIGTGRVVLNYEVKDLAGNTSTCGATITTTDSSDPCNTLNPVLAIAGSNCVNNEMSINGAMSASFIEWKSGTQVVSSTVAISTKAASGTTVAGNSDGTPGSDLSQLNNPTSVFVDKQGNTYVADINNERVLKFAPGSTTGTVVAGGNGAGDGSNQVNGPHNVFVDGSGNVYVSEFWNHRVTKWAPGSSTGTVVAGGNGGGANANQLQTPQGLYVDGSGTIYIADSGNHRILKWASGATSGTIVGKDVDGPTQVSLDGSGNIYVSEYGWFRIKKFPSNATNTTIGDIVVQDVSGSATGLHIDGAGFIYLCNEGENRIMKYPPNSTSTTVGTEIAGGNGAGVGANQLNRPGSVFVDEDGVIYIADRINNRVQKWTQTTTITPKYTPTVAGTYTADVSSIAGCKKTTNSLVITTCNQCDNDTTPPTLSNCPTNYASVLESDGTGVFELVDPTVTDNCDIASTVLKMTYTGGVTDGNGMTSYTTMQLMPLPLLYPVIGAGTIDIEYTVTDDAGNISKCASIMTIVGAGGACMNDVESPTTNNCPPNQVLNLVNGRADLEITTPTFMDNCAVESIKLVAAYRGGVTNSLGDVDRVFNNIFSGQMGTFTFLGAGKSTFDFIAFDPSGNESSCKVTYTTVIPGTDVLFNIASACAVAGQNISLPVTVTRFNAIGAFGFDLEVPAGSGLSFVGIERGAIDILAANVLVNGDLRIGWNESGGNNISLEDNFRVFNVILAADASYSMPSTVTGKNLEIESDINDQGGFTIGDICMASSVTPLGKILSPNGKPHAGVVVDLVTVGNTVTNTTSNTQGGYTFDFTNDTYRVKPTKDDEVRKGITISDIARIRRHYLKTLLIVDNYRKVAADVNKDGRISILDVSATNKVFLRKRNEFPNNTAWRFIPKSLDISSNPLDVNLTEQIKLQTPGLDYSNLDFVSIKTGDVDHSALDNFKGDDGSSRFAVSISVPDTIVSPQEMVTIPVYMSGADKVSALSFTMKYDTEVVELVSITAPNLKGFSAGSYNDIDGEVLIGWDHPQGDEVDAAGVLMMMTFKSKVTEGMSNITLEDATVFDINLETISVTTQNGSVDFMTSSVDDFVDTYKVTASPNPFLDMVNLTVDINTPQPLAITITDVTGRILKQMDIQNKSTNHQITIDDLDAKGVLIVLVKGDNFSETLRLIKL